MTRLAPATALLLALAVPARAQDATGSAGSGQTLTFYHWWTSPSEAAALSALTSLFSNRYPEAMVLAASVPGAGSGQALFPVIKRLAAAKQPPDAFQMNGGYAAQSFFDAALLGPIDDVWADDKLEDVIPAVVRDMNKFDGHYYAVPVAVHRTNLVWYNKPLLAKHKIDPARLNTWDAFFKAAQKLKAAGVKSPIQMGERWTATHVFECIMASLGIATYEDWINGKITAPDDPRAVQAFTLFERYLTFVNPDHAKIGWDAAVHRVSAGESAFCVMGDWANGEFRFAGMRYGVDYGTFLVPGTKGLYGLDVDAFLHPRGLADGTSSTRWLRLVASREGQDTFNPLKGSISARTDADVSRYDPYQRTAIAELKTARLMYPIAASGLPTVFTDRFNEIMIEFLAHPDPQKAARDMGEATVKLASTFSRTWNLK